MTTAPDDPEDREDDEDEPVAGGSPPAPPSNDIAAPAARAPVPRGPRRNLGATATQGAWAPWMNTEALPLWMEILGRQEQYPELGSAYDIEIRVRRVAPSGMPFQAFGGDAVMGSEYQSGADALLEYITEQCHLPTARGRAIYDVLFQWRKASRSVTGRLELPSPEEIIAVRNARQRMAPPQRIPPGPAPYASAAGPAAAPAYAAPTYNRGYDPVAHELAELRGLRGALTEALAAVREGRQPNIPSMAGPPAPPAPPATLEEAVERAVGRILPNVVNAVLSGLGVAPQSAASAAAASAPRVAADPIRNMADNFARDMVEASLSQVAKSIKTALGGIPRDAGAPPPPPPIEVTAEPVPAARPEDNLPFEATPIGDAKWQDGRPVMYTRDKETGNIDWAGALFGNPYVAERGIDIATKIGEALQGALTKMAGIKPDPTAAQVVREIPHGAVHAGVAGVYPPEPQKQPPPPPPPQTNGQTKAGWPQV